MKKMKSYDTVIFVGLDIPEDETQRDRVIQKVMNVTGVKKNKIFFYDKNTTHPASIVRGSYIRDKSQNSGYRIDETLCIASESIGAKRLSLEKLSHVGIAANTGYQDVDLLDMTESEILEWIETGRYTPHGDGSSGGEEESIDDFMSDLFGDTLGDSDDDGDTDEKESPKSEDDPVENNDNDVSESQQEEKEGSPGQHHTEVDGTPSASQQVPEPEDDTEDDIEDDMPEEAVDVVDDIIGGTPVDVVDDKSHITADEPQDEPQGEVFEAEIVTEDTEEYKLNNPAKSYHDDHRDDPVAADENEDDTSLDDILGNLTSDDDSYTPMRAPSRDDDSRIQHSSEEDNLSDLKNLYDSDLPEHKGSNIDEDVERYKRDNNVSEYEVGNGDTEYIDKIMEERKAAEKRKEKQRQEKQKDASSGDVGYLAQLQSMAGNNTSVAKDIEDEDRKHRVEQNSSEALSENTKRSDGKTKNYREYLGSDDYKNQVIDENIRGSFGNLDNYSQVHERGEDMNYVAKGKGRIILCTAGKGGVGKTLVSIGMASALSLARAYEERNTPGYSSSRTWLIESDYNSPKLAAAYGTGKKHLGNLARMLDEKSTITNSDVREFIENNVYRDPDTGVNVLACPPLSIGVSSPSIPMAIFHAIKYASNNGDDVIVDHGNLTVGEYSSLDKILASKTAHRVVVVGNMGCIDQTQTALDILTSRRPGSSVRPRNAQSVSVVLNKALEAQVYTAQESLKPFKIIAFIPPIDALREEYSDTGNTYLVNAPSDVKEAVYHRCGAMLTHLGYSSLQNYFVAKSSYNAPRKKGRRSPLKRIADRFFQ